MLYEGRRDCAYRARAPGAPSRARTTAPGVSGQRGRGAWRIGTSGDAEPPADSRGQSPGAARPVPHRGSHPKKRRRARALPRALAPRVVLLVRLDCPDRLEKRQPDPEGRRAQERAASRTDGSQRGRALRSPRAQKPLNFSMLEIPIAEK